MRADASPKEKRVRQIMGAMLAQGLVEGLLVPVSQPGGGTVMPALVASAAGLDRAVFLGPSFFINTARLAARISRKPSGRKTAVWMRPCEIRAFRELVKLNQASETELIILGADCPMALDREAYEAFALDPGTAAWEETFYPDPLGSGLEISGTCRSCSSPVPDQADLAVFCYGVEGEPVIRAGTPKGKEVLDLLGLPDGQSPVPRETVVKELTRAAQEAFETRARETALATDTLAKLDRFFSACINCYNCRTVCPVCYCRECVFNTEVFEHDPAQYHLWAARQDTLRLPSDTLFFHLTRLAHMGHACVGCGQCSRACPSGIPVADLFSTAGRHIQEALNYVPGGPDAPPFTTFKTDEFQDAVGID